LAVVAAILNIHPLAAGATADQALQEGLAVAFDAAAAGEEALLVGGQAFLVGQVLLPGEIGRIGVVEEDFPRFRREVNAAGVGVLGVGLFRAARSFAIGIGTGIGGVFEEAAEGGFGGGQPEELTALGAGVGTRGEGEGVVAEVAEEAAEGAELREAGEDVGEAFADSFVGVEGDRAVGLTDQADGEGYGQFAALGLVFAGGGEAAAEEMEFGFGEGAFETEEEAVVVGMGVVDAVGVGEEGVGEGTEFEEAVPVGIGAGEAGDLSAQDEADVTEGDVGDELLEGRAEAARGRGVAQVFVDDGDLQGGPAEFLGALDEWVLQGRALLMVLDLSQRRLTDVDAGPAGQMGGLNERIHECFSLSFGSGLVGSGGGPWVSRWARRRGTRVWSTSCWRVGGSRFHRSGGGAGLGMVQVLRFSLEIRSELAQSFQGEEGALGRRG
jgi:hypothetical protein